MPRRVQTSHRSSWESQLIFLRVVVTTTSVLNHEGPCGVASCKLLYILNLNFLMQNIKGYIRWHSRHSALELRGSIVISEKQISAILRKLPRYRTQVRWRAATRRVLRPPQSGVQVKHTQPGLHSRPKWVLANHTPFSESEVAFLCPLHLYTQRKRQQNTTKVCPENCPQKRNDPIVNTL